MLNLGTGLKCYIFVSIFLLIENLQLFLSWEVVSMMHGTFTSYVCFSLYDGNVTVSGETFLNFMMMPTND